MLLVCSWRERVCSQWLSGIVAVWGFIEQHLSSSSLSRVLFTMGRDRKLPCRISQAAAALTSTQCLIGPSSVRHRSFIRERPIDIKHLALADPMAQSLCWWFIYCLCAMTWNFGLSSLCVLEDSELQADLNSIMSLLQYYLLISIPFLEFRRTRKIEHLLSSKPRLMSCGFQQCLKTLQCSFTSCARGHV